MHSNAARDEIDVLLEGCLSQEVYVRNACLQTLQVRCSTSLIGRLYALTLFYSLSILLIWTGLRSCGSCIMIMTNRTLVWPNIYGMIMDLMFLKHSYKIPCRILVSGLFVCLSPKYSKPFLSIEHDHAYVRSSSGSALADCVEQYPSSISSVLEALEEFYREKVNGSPSLVFTKCTKVFSRLRCWLQNSTNT